MRTANMHAHFEAKISSVHDLQRERSLFGRESCTRAPTDRAIPANSAGSKVRAHELIFQRQRRQAGPPTDA